MAEMTFDQILRAARQLSPAQKEELIRRLRADVLTREQLIGELEGLRAAGAFADLASLKGQFARPGPLPDADEVEGYLRSLNSAWEQDLDGLAE